MSDFDYHKATGGYKADRTTKRYNHERMRRAAPRVVRIHGSETSKFVVAGLRLNGKRAKLFFATLSNARTRRKYERFNAAVFCAKRGCFSVDLLQRARGFLPAIWDTQRYGGVARFHVVAGACAINYSDVECGAASDALFLRWDEARRVLACFPSCFVS
jgi:hypothetical protein